MDLLNTPSLMALSFGYLLGSIPFGLVLAALGGKGDIRKIGSGNIGATNVLRTGSKFLALLTLILDSGKGAIALLLVQYYMGDNAAIAPLMAGFGAFLGHIFPLWLKFKGGKGVATYLGVIYAASWPTGLLVSSTWGLAALIGRMSSLSALVAALLAPLFGYYFGALPLMSLCLAMSILVFIRHSDNIKRILKGTEPKIGSKS